LHCGAVELVEPRLAPDWMAGIGLAPHRRDGDELASHGAEPFLYHLDDSLLFAVGERDHAPVDADVVRRETAESGGDGADLVLEDGAAAHDRAAHEDGRTTG